uniref:Putative conserved secreted protein n=1 Tax=Aedes albopictus TaxID=7160 RepID=A0A1W7R6Z6_AEDAL
MEVIFVKTYTVLFLILVMGNFHVVRSSSEEIVPINKEPTSVERSVVSPGGKQIFVAPVVCPAGQKPDHRGRCRQVWSL